MHTTLIPRDVSLVSREAGEGGGLGCRVTWLMNAKATDVEHHRQTENVWGSYLHGSRTNASMCKLKVPGQVPDVKLELDDSGGI